MRLNSMGRFCRLLLVATLASLVVACSGGSSGGASADAGPPPNGNAEHGKELYQVCQGCHKLTENSVGPMHCYLFGRAAGTVAGFDYSEAMKASGITWSSKKLDEFLTSPIAYVSGTKMGFAGFDNPSDRADVITYLYKLNHDPASCPPK